MVVLPTWVSINANTGHMTVRGNVSGSTTKLPQLVLLVGYETR